MTFGSAQPVRVKTVWGLDPRSTLTDISGLWAVRALLNGGISLGLRIQVSAASGETETHLRIRASFWLFEQSMDAPPLVTSETAWWMSNSPSWRTL